MNANLIDIIRMESPKIDLAFTLAEQASRNRARVEQGIIKMRAKLRQLEQIENTAFHTAVGMVADNTHHERHKLLAWGDPGYEEY